MYYFTFMQATWTHLHNKPGSALVAHHYYCLGTSSDETDWLALYNKDQPESFASMSLGNHRLNLNSRKIHQHIPVQGDYVL
jgi:hypothetical protein